MSRPLTEAMHTALIALYKLPESITTLREGTLNALISRGLLDAHFSITPLGSITAIGRFPLEEQCRALHIDLNTRKWDWSSSPEIDAYEMFRGEGYVGTYCEGGGFGAAIKALCLDALTETSIFYGTSVNAREDACLKGVVGLSHVETPKLEKIFNQIQQCSKTTYLAAFAEITSYGFIREWYPGLTLEFADALFDAVPKSEFVRLAKWVSLHHTHRNGWPDLTLVKARRLKLVEVKTKDRLHCSQLVTIPALMREINADISVLQLVRSKPALNPTQVRW